jgi:hypothetical protein
MGAIAERTTDDKGRLHFPALLPGEYVLDIELTGFTPVHDEHIRIGQGATIERNAVMTLAGVAASVVVEGSGSRLDARDPGVGTHFGSGEIGAIPTRRTSMFDFIRAVPGVSPTLPSSPRETTISALGSGVNENQWLIDGTNFTCPCNGVARSEPGVGHHEAFVEGDAHGVAAALLITAGAGVIHEDATHDAGRNGEEVRAVVPRDGLRVHEPEIGLVDERGGLEAVACPLAGPTAPRDVVELVVDERNQLRERSLVALSPGEKQSGDVSRMVRNAVIVGAFPRI